MGADDFISGRWVGSYRLAGSRDRHQVDLIIHFDSTGAMRGTGRDDVGGFHFTGKVDRDGREVRWTQTYRSHTASFRGFRDSLPSGLWGVWSSSISRGSFHFWPVGQGAINGGMRTQRAKQPQAPQ